MFRLRKSAPEKNIRKIISLKPGTHPSPNYEAEIHSQGGRILEHFPLINAVLCEFPVHQEGTVASIMESHPHVNRVEDDIPVNIIDFSPSFFFQPKKRETAKQMKQEIGWGIKKVAAEDYLGVEPQKRIAVAVMDTGIHLSHPDLQENIKGGISIYGNSRDLSDPNGHGTHVAGIIGALNNQIGVVGVMPKVDLYSVKVFNSRGEGSLTDIIRGLQWCIENQIKLVNLSFGSATENATFREVFLKARSAGLIMVAAAGNDAENHKMQYPAKYAETIAVTSSNMVNSLSSYSSYGEGVDVIAPGEQIISTWNDGAYKVLSGTSMAAPHVTGAIAQILNKWGDLSPVQVKQHLKSTASRLPLRTDQQGAGLINVAAALKLNPRVSQYWQMMYGYY